MSKLECKQKRGHLIAAIVLLSIISTICFLEVIQYRNHLDSCYDTYVVTMNKYLRRNEWQGYEIEDTSYDIIRPSKWASEDTWKVQVTFDNEPGLEYFFKIVDDRVYLIEVVGEVSQNIYFRTVEQ